MALAVILAATPAALAQTDEQPIITIQTNLYDVAGQLNDFVIYIGTTSDDYIDIDGGYGRVEVPVTQSYFDFENGEMKATQVACRVSQEGVVKIYGDPSKIDYLDCEGTYISKIEMPQLTNLAILNMNHNELGSLDLTPYSKLQYLTLNDNPFDISPLRVGGPKPELIVLSLDIIGDMTADFKLSDYPALISFSAWSNYGLKTLDPSACPALRHISIDSTDVASLDVSHNAALQILNISDTRIRTIDLTHNTELREFYAQHQSGTINTDIKLTDIDVTHCPELYYLYVAGNNITSIDLTNNTKLIMLGVNQNLLHSLNLDMCPDLFEVNVSNNYMDFATLPINPGTWNDYICYQYPMELNLSYPVGAEIDLSDRVLRQGHTTTAQLILTDSKDPNNYTPVEESAYTFANGKITLLQALPDSVYLQFYNDAFDDVALTTTKFKVKSTDEYGKPTAVCTYTDQAYVGSYVQLQIGITGATPENPKRVYVDPGSGTPVAFDITTSELPATPNVSYPVLGYKAKRILTDDGVYISALGLHSQVTAIDVSDLSDLRQLDLSNTGISKIDLQYARLLSYLDLSGNNFTEIDLAGVTGGFNKQDLHYIDISNNQLVSFTIPDNRVLVHLDLAGNHLSDLLFRDADYLQYLDISGNDFAELNLSYSTGLKHLNVASNHLNEITFAEGVQLDYLNVADNNFTFASMPQLLDAGASDFIYAPQDPIRVPTIGPGLSLQAQDVTIKGHNTTFTLLHENGNPCSLGTDYTIDNGRIRFVNTGMGNVYCSMTNAALPGLTLTTTLIEAAGMPTNVLATFTTPVGGENVVLSLAAANAGTGLYIDWTGHQDLDQYLLETEYTLFPATTTAGATVKAYTYGEQDAISVFSVTGATMGSLDASGLKDAYCLTFSNAALSDITLPVNPGLKELNLSGNNFSRIDLSAYPELYLLVLSNNKFSSFDFSPFPALQVAAISANHLESLTLDNPSMWMLAAGGNRLTSVDLSNLRHLRQLGLDDNQLTEIDLSANKELIALDLSANRFNFGTLPLPSASYSVYAYGNQSSIKAVDNNSVVDLSFNKQAADGTLTTYRWFVGAPQLNEEGELEGEELYIDDEYTLDEGVTTFLGTFPAVVCAMTNEALPKLIMYTEPLAITSVAETVTPTDIDIRVENGSLTISSAIEMPVALYAINGTAYGTRILHGTTTYSALQNGVYVLVTPAGPYKIIVR